MNKGDNNQGKGGGCPGHEFLCSYFDNELDRTSPESVHISSCPECMMKIGDFARIGKIISENMMNECSPPHPGDILKKVRAEISDEKETEVPSYLFQFMKVAAIIVVIVGVFAYVHSLEGNKVHVPGAAGIKTAPAATSISSVPSAKQNTREAASLKHRMPENEVQFSNMSNVSTGRALEFRNPQPDGIDRKAEPVSIPDCVNHVWTVKNLVDASAEINDCAAKLGIPAGGISVSKENDNMLKYSMNLSKKQISGFVKLFASAGNELISPVAPQPEQNLFYGNAADTVDYEIKVVQKGK
ncbi:MAG: hypothetical protein WC637_05750 [Victivallales bacterium]|jgi:hypothetical protein